MSESVGLDRFNDDTKTAKGRRSVALDGMTLQALRSSRKAQRQERLRLGAAWQGLGLRLRAGGRGAVSP